MARPRELFNTPAPQAMSMMGQGIADAYANVGRIEGQGMQAMGQGIAQGLTSAASSVASYMKEAKQLESQNKSYENFLNNKVGQSMLGYSEKDAKQLIEEAKKMSIDNGIRAGNDFLNLAVGGRLQQQNKLQLVNAAHGPKRMPTNLGSIEKGIDDILNLSDDGFSPRPVTPPQAQPQYAAQDATTPAMTLSEFLRQRGWRGPGAIPPALMAEWNALTGQ
jgi:hypothetical protein